MSRSPTSMKPCGQALISSSLRYAPTLIPQKSSSSLSISISEAVACCIIQFTGPFISRAAKPCGVCRTDSAEGIQRLPAGQRQSISMCPIGSNVASPAHHASFKPVGHITRSESAFGQCIGAGAPPTTHRNRNASTLCRPSRMQPARQTEGARKSARPGWDSSPAGKAAKKPSRATAIRSTTTPPTGQSPAKPMQRDRPWSAAMSTASSAVARKQSLATKENDALNHADRCGIRADG